MDFDDGRCAAVTAIAVGFLPVQEGHGVTFASVGAVHVPTGPGPPFETVQKPSMCPVHTACHVLFVYSLTRWLFMISCTSHEF